MKIFLTTFLSFRAGFISPKWSIVVKREAKDPYIFPLSPMRPGRITRIIGYSTIIFSKNFPRNAPAKKSRSKHKNNAGNEARIISLNNPPIPPDEPTRTTATYLTLHLFVPPAAFLLL
ncbi:magnesium transporter [Thermococcus sibiricus MM 739]|uniref:Magnesium transporter n=1 Tax=Thermococcus sibiricus (strain DSM 12597 / MM 739) TaxID=604354 RepID=C6A0S5_THESM|nr:magnesium transporter [Thermococcus sibiricus MM 739]